MEAIVGVLDRARAAADAELFGRDALDPGTFLRAPDFDGDIMQLGRGAACS
jgi:hypothetical protein